MKFENVRVMNFEGALLGMRNPKESWDRSDSKFGLCSLDAFAVEASSVLNKWKEAYSQAEVLELQENLYYNGILTVDKTSRLCEYAFIGPKDMELARTLIRAGSEHRKFMRQIFVTVDITAPLFFYKEFDTYKVGTVANSTSTMHKLASKPITFDCFETGDMKDFEKEEFQDIIDKCEKLRLKYTETKDVEVWKALVRILPESWLQTRTITMNYENLFNICKQRKNHKLYHEWVESFIENFAKNLPYAEDLIFCGQE